MVAKFSKPKISTDLTSSPHAAQATFFVVVGLAGLLVVYQKRHAWLAWWRQRGSPSRGRGGRGQGGSSSRAAPKNSGLTRSDSNNGRSGGSAMKRWGDQLMPPRSPSGAAGDGNKRKGFFGIGLSAGGGSASKSTSPARSGSRSPTPIFFSAPRNAGEAKGACPTAPNGAAAVDRSGSSLILPGVSTIGGRTNRIYGSLISRAFQLQGFSSVTTRSSSSKNDTPGAGASASMSPPSPPPKSEKRRSGTGGVDGFKSKLKNVLNTKKDKAT